jgi:uncharacterized protein (DUF736 family)
MSSQNSNTTKRPLSAYILFCRDQRNSIKESHPEYKVTDITKELGVQWRNISEKDKKYYENLASKEKSRYQNEIKDNPPQRKEKSTKKEKVIDDKPKRPLSSYIIFCSNMRSNIKSENPSFGPKEVTKKLGEVWRSLSDSEKASYKVNSSQVAEQEEIKPKVKKVEITTKKSRKKVVEEELDDE